MNRRNLFLLARALVAVAGIGYIVWSLTWTDRIRVPARTRSPAGELVTTVLPDGTRLVDDRSFPVLRGDADAFHGGGLVTIEVPTGAGPREVAVPAESRGTGPHEYRFDPGIVTTVRRAAAGTLALAFLVLAPIFPIQAARWLILLRAAGIEVGFGKSFRLVMVGCFFNYCAPGTTGGDVAKAYYAARGSGRVAVATMSVLVDRLVGMAGLLVVGSLAGLLVLDDPVAWRVTLTVWLLAAALVVAAILYSSRRLRDRLRLAALVSRLPGHELIAGVDRALLAYRDRKAAVAGALALAVAVHACAVASTVLAGRALGIERSLGLMAAVIPLVIFVGAIPVSYQGLGTMEAVAVPLLVASPGATVNQVVGMLLVHRILLLAYSLTGSLYLVRGDIHLHQVEGQVEGQRM